MPDTEPSESPRRPFQFGLWTLFLLTALLSVLAAAFAGMLRSSLDSSMQPGFFVIMAAAAPLAAIIVISLCRATVRWLGRRRR
ncbi:MAG: hypothetical protein A2V70_02320 [Planctomycetes bacterium RBG_13_63_9]|nr:MAG: hypothetical protein A2V70_02320 [Planctomycetes bacterium RBG_13_63_9]